KLMSPSVTMQEIKTLIVGASFSGLASAVTLQRRNIDYIIIEKESHVAAAWRNHYNRLHLHTTRNLSHLPYKKFASNVPRYPSRQQVVDYLVNYQSEFNVQPIFNTEATCIKSQNDHWITETTRDTYRSKYMIVAAGPFGKPKPVSFNGMETFPGKILHSYGYKTGEDFNGQRVLVVGFGNSACEIAIDLFEQGAEPAMSVRSPVNIVPRELMRIPILKLSLLFSRLPPPIADAINAPVIRLVFGDITKLGLRKMPYGVFQQIKKDGNIPVLDIGTIEHIRQGHIKIFGDIDHIQGKTIYFTDGKRESFDAIVAAIGYYRDYAQMIDVEQSRFDDLKVPVDKQRYFGNDGLYFCGFWIAPTGQIREISLDAQKIAQDIARKEGMLR
ncbi:MAG TPA: NAD(P)/FAD-dependent oxidoreductase, partial [Chitinophagaceae bacterium]|nr:NAD(P)/FAD-dependent oxidoreductase [Chitinophagaceae bacterium]